MMNIDRDIILKTIKYNKQQLKIFGVKKLILFGSYARNEHNLNSDIDLLVEFKKDRGNYRDYLDLLHFLEDIFNKKIDLGETNSLRKELKPYILEGVKYETTI